MILNCPQCSSRFLVADALIPGGGRSVRCGACSHEWFVERPATAEAPAPEPVPPAPEPVPETAPALDTPAASAEAPTPPPIQRRTNVPAIPSTAIAAKPLMIAAPLLALLWLVLAMFTYFPNWVDAPVAGGIYRMFGITQTQGLAFAEVTMEREDTDTKTRFILAGKIVNHANVVREIPIVHVGMVDRDGAEIWGRDYPVNIALKPGEEYPFRIVNVETSFADRVASLRLDMGHALELMVR